MRYILLAFCFVSRLNNTPTPGSCTEPGVEFFEAASLLIVRQPLLRDRICKPGSVLTAIYLGAVLPRCSSHLLGSSRAGFVASSTVLLRIEFTAPRCSHVAGELLPRLSTLTADAAVYLCCTFPGVAPGGCYPLSLPYGARTFLTKGLSAHCARLNEPVAGLL